MTEQRKNSLISVDDIGLVERSSLPSKIIVLLIVVIPLLSTLLFGAVDNATWIFISILWLGLVVCWTADSWISGGIPFNSSSLQLPLLGLILVGLVQLLPLGGAVGGLSSEISTTLSMDPHSTRFFVVKLVVYFTYFAACLTYINDQKRLTRLVWLIVIFGSGMAFYGILQKLATPEGIYGMRTTSGATPFGPFVNQHHFATFMQMTGGLALSLLFAPNAARERRLLLAAALVLMGVATVSTSSRGGLLGFLGVISFVIILNLLGGRWSRKERSGFGQQRLAIAAAGIALVIVIFGVALLIGGNDSLLRGVGVVKADADISSGRLHFWPIAWKIFLAHPVIGSGLESFGVAFPKYDTWSGQFRVEQAHNEYLQMLADAGIVGFVLLMGFIIILFRKALATIAASEGLRRDTAIGALAGCFGVMLHSFFDFPLRTPSNAFFFLLLCTFATVSLRSYRSRRRSTEH